MDDGHCEVRVGSSCGARAVAELISPGGASASECLIDEGADKNEEEAVAAQPAAAAVASVASISAEAPGLMGALSTTSGG